MVNFEQNHEHIQRLNLHISVGIVSSHSLKRPSFYFIFQNIPMSVDLSVVRSSISDSCSLSILIKALFLGRHISVHSGNFINLTSYNNICLWKISPKIGMVL